MKCTLGVCAARLLLAAACAIGVDASRAFGAVVAVPSGGNLQKAINAAKAGDEIRLAPGATFTGNFTLPVHSGTDFITIRTDLPDGQLPGDTERVTPAQAGAFARIVSNNTAAALATVPGAHHWRILFIEFPPTRLGYGDIIRLGDGSNAQSSLAQVPHDLVLDRVYVHGSPTYGQKRGIALNASAVTIRNSYISECKAVGQDSQAIAGWNGPGPFVIENNYIEGAGENFGLGGSDPPIAGLVSQDITFTYNHVTRPLSWRDPIIAAPSAPAASVGAGGALAPGTYGYRVVARRPVGEGTTGQSAPSVEAVVRVAAAGSAITLSWTPVSGATEYQVFGRQPGAETQYWMVGATTFRDTGAAGKSGSATSVKASVWQVKNLFELKNARNVLVDSNVFENNWQQAQVGYAIVLTPRNQDGRCSWCIVAGVVFSHNIVRHTAGAINILGYDSPNQSQQTNDIQVTGNLFYDISKAYGGNGWFGQIGDEPRDVVFDHNTIDMDGSTVLAAYGGSASHPRAIESFRFSNNAAPHGTYGLNGSNASAGTLTIQMYYPSGIVAGNWLSGGKASSYPPGNRFDAPFAAMFMNRAAGDYRLVQGSPLQTAATGGGPVGADVQRLLGQQPAIVSGDSPTGRSLRPPTPTRLRIVS